MSDPVPAAGWVISGALRTTLLRVAATRVFVAQMVGLAVFGPDGERIGKVRDVVAAVRVDDYPPRVLGLVVDVATRRRIFVPMLRVTGLDPGAITLATGSVSLRRFSQRVNETLVVGQLLDAPVRIADTGEDVIVVDAAMEPTRTRDWVVGRLAVRARRTRLTRRPEVRVIPWRAVTGLSLTDRQGTEGLLAVLETMRAADVASTLTALPMKRRHEVVDALDDERLADVFEELAETDQRALLTHLSRERAADVLEAMAPDDAADLLGELPATESAELLELMEPEESEPVRRLLRYSSDTAGGLMTPEPVILPPRRDGRRGARPHPQPRHPARAGEHGVRLPPADRDTHRPLPRLRARPTAAAGGPVRAGRRGARQGAGAADPGRRRSPGRPLLRGLQPGGRAGRRHRGAPARRGDRRRRARPPAARQLAGGRLADEQDNPADRATVRTAPTAGR